MSTASEHSRTGRLSFLAVRDTYASITRRICFILSAAVGGWLIAESLIWPKFGFAAWLGVLALLSSLQTTTTVSAIASSLVASVFFWYTLLGWALMANGWSWGLQAGAASIAAFEGLYLAAWTVVYRQARAFPVALRLAVIASAWILCEGLRASGAWCMPYGRLGDSQSDTVIGHLLPFIGSSGIATLMLILLEGLIIACERCARSAGAGRVSLVAILVGLSIVFAMPLPLNTTHRSAAQTGTFVSAPASFIAASANDSELQSIVATLGAIDAVVLPEGAVGSTGEVASLQEAADRLGFPIVSGFLLRDGNQVANGAMILSPKKKPRSYVKQRLVPFGEFVPLRQVFGAAQGLPDSDLQRGTDFSIWPLGFATASPLICFEMAFPDLVSGAVDRGADLLIVPLNDLWFKDPAGISMQLAVAKTRAREYGVDILIAPASGRGYAFNADGSQAQTSLLSYGLSVDAFQAPKASFYSKARGREQMLFEVLLGGLLFLFILGRLRRQTIFDDRFATDRNR